MGGVRGFPHWMGHGQHPNLKMNMMTMDIDDIFFCIPI